MKIAICGTQAARRKELTSDFIKQWVNYKTPAKTIEDDIPYPDDVPALKEMKELLNPAEQILMTKMHLIESQMEKYREQNYIVYNGCLTDILIATLILAEDDIVSDEFVEKVIYHHKNAMRKFDIVFWAAYEPTDNPITDEEMQYEQVYQNLYDNYCSEFNESPFFHHTDTAAFIKLETNNPIAEMQVVVSENGNQYDEERELMDMKQLARVIKNPKLLAAAKKSLERKKQPEVIVNNGTF